jgi:hypothetical protein
MRRLDRFLLAFALLPVACGEPRIHREQAIAIAQAHLGESASRSPLVVRIAYERRSTWLVKFMYRGGGTGGGPSFEIDKRTGKVLMVYAFQ